MTQEVNGRIYYVKGDGTLVPEDQVKDTDKLRDQFVMDLAARILSERHRMQELKKEAIEEINAFMDTMAESYGVKLGGEKGNVSFSSFDGSIQIALYRNDTLSFNETIQVARKLIDEYLEDITKDSSSDIKQIVSAAFALRQGKLDVKAILKLRELNIDDERWKKAMTIIDESKKWTFSNKSLRVYIRNAETGKLEYQPMDFAMI